MKTAGYFLLILGSFFWLLFFGARLGGASMPPTPLTVGAMLAIAGWKFISFSKAAKRQASPVDGMRTASTVPMPLTPELKTLLEAELARGRRIICWIAGGFFVLFVLAGLAIGAAVPGANSALAISITAGLGLLFIAIVALIWTIFGEAPVRRDRNAAEYLRTSGEVATSAVAGGTLVRVGDQAFLANCKPALKTLRDLSAATVDHSRYAHMIFEVRDTYGRTVYRAPGYSDLATSR